MLPRRIDDSSDRRYQQLTTESPIRNVHAIRMKADILSKSKQIQGSSPPTFVIVASEEFVEALDNNFKIMHFGTTDLSKPQKVIMVVGATGTGKTTLINGMVNYILGVDFEDPFRFKLIREKDDSSCQASSRTSWITSYTLYHEKGFDFHVPYTVTIIDTPGFGNTSGIMQDKEITDQIREFFTKPGSVDQLDAVGFVVQSSLPTAIQKYTFDAILALFGNDIKDNIFMLLTFADDQRPQVLDVLQEIRIPYKDYFTFNNSALCADPDDTEKDGNFDKLFWEMNLHCFKQFFDKINTVVPATLTLTKSVLEQRYQLNIYIQSIREEVQRGLNKLDQLKKEAEVIKEHEHDIELNREFKYTVTEEVVELEPTAKGEYTTKCLKCKKTCHYPCSISESSKIGNCTVMSGGKCTMCPGNCVWSVHRNLPHKYVIVSKQVEKIAAELKARYEESEGKKKTAEELIQHVLDEFQAIQAKVLFMTDCLRKCIAKLEEISLKPAHMTHTDYIDILIQNEKDEARDGWSDRVQQLSNLRKQAVFLKDITSDGGYDPFKLDNWKAKLEEEQTTGKRGPFTIMWEGIEKAGKGLENLLKKPTSTASNSVEVHEQVDMPLQSEGTKV